MMTLMRFLWHLLGVVAITSTLIALAVHSPIILIIDVVWAAYAFLPGMGDEIGIDTK